MEATAIEVKTLTLSFDLNTLDHLGIKLYGKIPPMIAELVSNAWDADAKKVSIYFNDIDKKEIIISDNGTGMTFEEINNHYLRIGRNRRVEMEEDFTSKEHRPILGKKGLGKLSVFGIGKELTVTTIKDGLINEFTMNYDDIKKHTDGTYNPELNIYDEETDLYNGTTINIKNIVRSGKFNAKEIALDLSKRFTIFSDDFQVFIYHNDDEPIKVTNDLYFDSAAEFTWNFPNDYLDIIDEELISFAIEKKITGKIFTASNTIYKSKQGIILFSRGKLVEENNSFNKRANDNFFNYMSGYFNIDFIDENGENDYSSTDRKSIAWDTYGNDDLITLEQLLTTVVNKTQSEWRRKRNEAKETEIKEFGLDISEWLDELTPVEKPIAKKITDAIINNDDIDTNKAKEYIGYIQDMFDYESFKSFTVQLDELISLDDERAIKLLTDWQIIETKELAKVAEGRIKTIEQFEKYIKENVSESKVMQKFLEEFPWLLDAKMTRFEREVTFARLLKDNFNDSHLEQKNRRIDFLCTNQSGTVHIIELKRPNIKITQNEIQQISEYVEFIETKFHDSVNKVYGYLISDNMQFAPGISKMIDGLKTQGIYVKSYSDLLNEAKNYNFEFIKLYEDIREKTKD
ncbi:ATP-binding protein [Tissierella carlieri]|uniref:ATP-binding protein n=1 Tax=Tissierella carlieri TaxID=689904 RepID=UPI001C126C4E|nr:ATP-binding protein [Tissierella carlieri]MBU5311863.1 ATP-binding protein [Tissierella carlieri]